MKPTIHTTTIDLHHPPEPDQALTIRLASTADAAALSRLAQLDSAPRPKPVATLVAVVGDEVQAALPLDGGTVIANPFRRTAELVPMLADRAAQLTAPEPQRARRRSRLRNLGAAASRI